MIQIIIIHYDIFSLTFFPIKNHQIFTNLVQRGLIVERTSNNIISISGNGERPVEILLPDSNEWTPIVAGKSFEVPANSKFKIVVTEVTDYCCSYLD